MAEEAEATAVIAEAVEAEEIVAAEAVVAVVEAEDVTADAMVVVAAVVAAMADVIVTAEAGEIAGGSNSIQLRAQFKFIIENAGAGNLLRRFCFCRATYHSQITSISTFTSRGKRAT